jgi:hypothetical protein
MTVAERLKIHASVLDLIDRRRSETGDAYLGSGIEAHILAIELGELETEILESPGALEKILVRVRRS